MSESGKNVQQSQESVDDSPKSHLPSTSWPSLYPEALKKDDPTLTPGRPEDERVPEKRNVLHQEHMRDPGPVMYSTPAQGPWRNSNLWDTPAISPVEEGPQAEVIYATRTIESIKRRLDNSEAMPTLPISRPKAGKSTNKEVKTEEDAEKPKEPMLERLGDDLLIWEKLIGEKKIRPVTPGLVTNVYIDLSQTTFILKQGNKSS